MQRLLATIEGGATYAELTYPTFSNRSVERVMAAVASSTSLVRLTVCGADAVIRPTEGIVAIAEAVAKSTSLRILQFDRRMLVDDAGAIAIADAIERSETLTSVYMCICSFGDVGAFALAKAIRSSISLAGLYIDNVHISNAGALAIVASVARSNMNWIRLGSGENETLVRACNEAIQLAGCTSRMFALMGCTGNTPAARFVWLDGDHAIATRVLRSMLKQT